MTTSTETYEYVNKLAVKAFTEAGWVPADAAGWLYVPGPDAKEPRIPGAEELSDILAEVVLDRMGKYAKSWGVVEVGMAGPEDVTP